MTLAKADIYTRLMKALGLDPKLRVRDFDLRLRVREPLVVTLEILVDPQPDLPELEAILREANPQVRVLASPCEGLKVRAADPSEACELVAEATATPQGTVLVEGQEPVRLRWGESR